MKDRGVDALVNECLINPVLTMGAVFVAYACSLLAYLYIEFTKPAYNENGGYTPVVMVNPLPPKPPFPIPHQMQQTRSPETLTLTPNSRSRTLI